MKCLQATSTLLQRNQALSRYAARRSYSTAAPSVLAPLALASASASASASRAASRPVSAARVPRRNGATHPVITRPFSATARSLKKMREKDRDSDSKQKQKRAALAPAPAPAANAADDNDGGAGRPKPNAEDPFDMADLRWAWDRLARRHEEALKAARGGGRFNADAIGAVPVRAAAGKTVPLRELATVQPKTGRKWSILCFEAASKKAIKSAVQAHPDFNQQPQEVADNESELVVAVEPERADALEKRVDAVCHLWREGIRAERSKRDRVAKQWRSDNVLSADAKRKMDTTLQKLQDERMAVVDRKEAEVKKSIRSIEW